MTGCTQSASFNSGYQFMSSGLTWDLLPKPTSRQLFAAGFASHPLRTDDCFPSADTCCSRSLHHPKLLKHDWKGKPSVWPHFGSCSSVIQCFVSLCSEWQCLGSKQDSFPDAQPESSTPIFFYSTYSMKSLCVPHSSR